MDPTEAIPKTMVEASRTGDGTFNGYLLSGSTGVGGCGGGVLVVVKSEDGVVSSPSPLEDDSAVRRDERRTRCCFILGENVDIDVCGTNALVRVLVSTTR